MFEVPVGLVRILNRDLKAAGIPKRDDRGRTVDVHAMRHSDIKLTMGVCTDPCCSTSAGRWTSCRHCRCPARVGRTLRRGGRE